jgi:transposase
MGTHRKHTLSDAQRQELEQFSMTTRASTLFRRAKIIVYKDEGMAIAEIQKHTGYSAEAQDWWWHRYRHEGLEGLHDKPRSGRPRHMPPPPPLSEPSSAREAPTEVGLPYWARVTVEQMYAHHPKRYLRERAHLVLLRDKGYAIPLIADILGTQVRTVRTILTRYDQDGIAGLYRNPGSGRISGLRPDQWNQVKEWVVKGPKALGYRFVKWTTRSLRAYLWQHFGRRFSREWIRQKLHDFLRYSWTRGKIVYAYADDPAWKAKRQRFCRQVLTLLQQASKGEILLLFLDETILSLFGKVGYRWSPVGTTHAVASVGKRERVVVFGAADPIAGRTHYRQEDTINQHSTLRFLKQLLRYYQKHRSNTPVVLVFDKHNGHTATIVAELLVEHEHLSVLTTPPKSPDLNPQEHIWEWLDEQMINDEFFEHTAEIKKAVRHFFSYIAGLKEDVIRYLGNLQTLYSAEAGIEVEI